MMNAREEFLKHCETFEIESFNDRTLAKFTWEACEKVMLEKIESHKEYYEMVMQDCGKRIAGLEEKLRVAREALLYWRNECSGNEPSLSVFEIKVDEALKTIEV